jgi:hypothetical protein
VVVLAGDIHVGTRGIGWASRHFAGTPVIYVPGNHEHYGGRLQDVLAALQEEGRRRGVHVLEQEEVTLGGVRFLGATLWTDFELYGSDPASMERAMNIAEAGMSDFQVVRYADEGRLRPAHVRQIHLDQVRWLDERLASGSGPAVVVTHHLPHARSIHPRFEGGPFGPAFASDLARLLRPPIALWIHGHTHDSMDYMVNGTRVVCNPRGYIPYEPNEGFDPRLTVAVTAGARPPAN